MTRVAIMSNGDVAFIGDVQGVTSSDDDECVMRSPVGHRHPVPLTAERWLITMPPELYVRLFAPKENPCLDP